MLKSKKKYLLFVILVIGAFAIYIGVSQNSKENVGGNLISGSVPPNVVYADTLSKIETEMHYLVSEIETKMKSNPQMAILGHPSAFIKESSSYKNIIALGLEAVKPLYDKLYDSRDAGLYEYILAMAVQEITQEDFADKRLSDSQKAEQFRKLGVFAVSSLIKECNNTTSKIPKNLIEDSIRDITAKYKIYPMAERGMDSNNTGASLINKNKELFDSLVDLNGRAYKK